MAATWPQWAWAVVTAQIWLLSIHGMQADAQGASPACELPYGANISSQLGAPYIIQQQTDVEHAKNFTVQYGTNHKVVRNYGANHTYVLQQCGVEAQDDLAAALNGEASTFTVKQFTVPLVSIAVDGSTSVNFLELLGLVGRIKLLGKVVSPCVRQQLESDPASQLNSTDSDAFLKQMEPLSAVLDTGSLFFLNISVGSLNKSISFRDNTAEYSPLKRAEWIKYLSLFFNLEQLATGIFKQIEDNYNCLAKMPAPATKPVVAWASAWFDMMTGAPTKYQFSASTYLGEFVKDAGGVSLVDTKTESFNASIPSEVAAFHDKLKTVDILIDDTYNNGKSYSFSNFTDLYKLPESVTFPFMTTNVWRSDKRIGDNYFTDWFGMAVAQPQVVLGDLISIISPGKAPWQRTFFRNLANETETILKPENCGPANSPVSPTILQCSMQEVAPVVASEVAPVVVPKDNNKAEVSNAWSLATVFLPIAATAVAIAL